MKYFTLFILLLLMAATANADDVFRDSDLKDLRIFAISKSDGIAWIRDKNGNETEVYIGDTIGIEGREVVSMDKASITVRLGNTYTKLRLFISNEEAEINALEIDPSLVD